MESKLTFEVIEQQIRERLVGLTCKSSFSIIIAYEPIWAIGTGRTATPDQIQEIHIFIRKIYAEMYGKAAEEIRILYGGSVNSYNISNLMRKSDIDGSLVGGASLEVECFIKLIEYFKKKNFVEG
jgi:triosephosphate isomerase